MFRDRHIRLVRPWLCALAVAVAIPAAHASPHAVDLSEATQPEIERFLRDLRSA